MPNVSPPGAGPTTQVQTFTDFTGGLNLSADTFKLAPNESPSMVNVDVSRRGGVSRRRAWVEEEVIGQTKGFALAIDGSTRHVVWQQDDDTLWYWEGGVPIQLILNAGSDTSTTASVVDPSCVANDTAWDADEMHWATYEGLTYGTRGFQTTGEATISYDPSGVAALTDSSVTALSDPAATAYQDDFDTPSGTHFPICRYVTEHQELMWAGYTTESSTEYPNRVRWSHPGDAGSWRTNDWIDVEPNDGDVITGLCQFRDQLLVFKRHSVHAIFGYSPDTFQVVNVADTVGAVSQAAIACNESGAFFFDEHDGVFMFDGQGLRWLFSNIHEALLDGRMNQPQESTMAWLGRRLWVNVRWDGLSDEGRTFVFDQDVGSWTCYEGFKRDGDIAPNNHIRHAFEYSTDGVTFKYYAELAYTETTAKSSLLEVEINDVWQDVYTSGPASFTVDAVYKTSWIDLGQPARPKRWRRPEFVISGGVAQSTQVRVWSDWNQSTTTKQMTLTTDALGGDTLWGAANWGAFNWAQPNGEVDEIINGSNIGATGRALQFEFTVPHGLEWELNALSVKWRNKRLKG